MFYHLISSIFFIKNNLFNQKQPFQSFYDLISSADVKSKVNVFREQMCVQLESMEKAQNCGFFHTMVSTNFMYGETELQKNKGFKYKGCNNKPFKIRKNCLPADILSTERYREKPYENKKLDFFTQLTKVNYSNLKGWAAMIVLCDGVVKIMEKNDDIGIYKDASMIAGKYNEKFTWLRYLAVGNILMSTDVPKVHKTHDEFEGVREVSLLRHKISDIAPYYTMRRKTARLLVEDKGSHKTWVEKGNQDDIDMFKSLHNQAFMSSFDAIVGGIMDLLKSEYHGKLLLQLLTIVDAHASLSISICDLTHLNSMAVNYFTLWFNHFLHLIKFGRKKII